MEEGEKNLEISDFWDKNDTRPIHLKEAEAVYRVLKALGGRLVDSGSIFLRTTWLFLVCGKVKGQGIVH